MCGRYTVRSIQKIVESFDVTFPPELFPRFNIAPTQDVPVVRLDKDGNRKGTLVHWGLIPSWAKDPKIGNRMINARAETVGEKPAFRAAFGRRRCLVPADGFYEWKKTGKVKQPFFIHMKNDAPFALAGLWERWKDPNSDTVVDSCTLLTTTPNELMESIHDRMPVIVAREDWDKWLDPKTSPEALSSLLRSYPAELMEAYPVSTRVNSPANEDDACSRRAEEPKSNG